MLELWVCYRLGAIRRDPEWCDRGGRAPRIEGGLWHVGEPTAIGSECVLKIHQSAA